jgi:transposase
MILIAAKGVSNDEIAIRLDACREVVSLWRKRFVKERLAGLEEGARPGRPRLPYDAKTLIFPLVSIERPLHRQLRTLAPNLPSS